MLFWRKKAQKQQNPTPKTLVVLDGNTWQERAVEFEDELQVSDGDRSFPKKDLPRFWTEDGEEVYLVNAPQATLIQAEALEEVRQSNVLRNVFAYNKPAPNPNLVIFIGLIVVAVVAAWR